VSLAVPSTPATVSGFTATSGGITIQEDSAATISLTVAGNALALTCTAYPNNTVTPSGITTATPSAAPIAPVIALAGGGSTSTTAPPTPTTKPPASKSGGGSAGGTGGASTVVATPSALAFTGPGPGIGVLGVIGGALILLGFALLVLVDAPRRAISRLVLVSPSTWRRVRVGDLAERLASLNPMRWRKGRTEGVLDTSITEPAQPTAASQPEAEGWGGYTATRERGFGDRFSKVPVVSRELAQTTARHAMRTAQWLLGR
jgi:hypothetical protein